MTPGMPPREDGLLVSRDRGLNWSTVSLAPVQQPAAAAPAVSTSLDSRGAHRQRRFLCLGADVRGNSKSPATAGRPGFRGLCRLSREVRCISIRRMKTRLCWRATTESSFLAIPGNPGIRQTFRNSRSTIWPRSEMPSSYRRRRALCSFPATAERPGDTWTVPMRRARFLLCARAKRETSWSRRRPRRVCLCLTWARHRPRPPIRFQLRRRRSTSCTWKVR